MQRDFSKWDRYNFDLLKALFIDSAIADEYDAPNRGPVSVRGGMDYGYYYTRFLERVKDRIGDIESLCERIQLIVIGPHSLVQSLC